MPEVNPSSAWCQRWSDRRGSWTHPDQGGFTASRYRVAPVPESIARPFIERHHYAGSYPAGRLAYGLLDTEPDAATTADPGTSVAAGAALVGVAVLGVPMQAKVLTNVFPHLDPYAQSLELSRFVCLPCAPANAETFFLARMFRLAADDGLRGIVSFADPMPRRRALPDGTTQTISPGHCGLIYQASNGIALGRSTPRRLVYVPAAGLVLPARTLQKVAAGESGASGAEAQLVALGARPRPGAADRRAWLADALGDIGAIRVAHPGNFRYAWPLGDRAARRTTVITGTRTRYPKPATDRMPDPLSGVGLRP